jgi:hypothetical protein
MFTKDKPEKYFPVNKLGTFPKNYFMNIQKNYILILPWNVLGNFPRKYLKNFAGN